MDRRLEIADFTQVVATYDAVAVDYAAAFPTTEPEDALDLATIDHFVARLGATSRTWRSRSVRSSTCRTATRRSTPLCTGTP